MRTITQRFLLLLLGLSQCTLQATTTSQCKCVYGEPCWPSFVDFAKLSAEVPEPLLRPLPPASPCYASANSTECAEVVNRWHDGNWRADQPGSMQAPNFETYTFPDGTIEACYLNTTLGVPCGQGSVPVVGVDARSSWDVQAAVKFAARHNLRLVACVCPCWRRECFPLVVASDGRVMKCAPLVPKGLQWHADVHNYGLPRSGR